MTQGEQFPMNDKEKELLRREEEEVGHGLEEIHGGPEYGMCFACGEKNPIGLHLHFVPGHQAPLPAGSDRRHGRGLRSRTLRR